MRVQAIRAVETAAERTRAAEVAMAEWAGGVRRGVEVRLGIGMDDPRAWEDPAPAAALDMYRELERARDRMERAFTAMKLGPETATKED